MTKLMFHTGNFPFPDRDEFLTPFDKIFDHMLDTQFHIQRSTYMNTMTKLVSLLRFQDSIRNNSMLKLKMVY